MGERVTHSFIARRQAELDEDWGKLNKAFPEGSQDPLDQEARALVTDILLQRGRTLMSLKRMVK